MKVIILSAGYSTRLGKLTEKIPKGLLTSKGKPIINYLLDELATIKQIDEVTIVTNNKYYSVFNGWLKKQNYDFKLDIINDHTTSNQNRLGAIGDVQYTITQKNIDDDVMIAACDDLFDFKLIDYYNFFVKENCDCALGSFMAKEKLASRMAVACVDNNNIITNLEEKPIIPKSNLGIWAIYIYQKDTINLIHQYLNEGNNPDAPGNFLSYLYKKKPVKVFMFEGNCIDIGTIEDYNKIK